MSPDEFFVGMFCVVIALITWGSWYLGIVMVSGLASPLAVRLPVYLAPLLAAGGLLVVLRTLASWDVRESPLYLAFYLVFGAAWVGITTRIQRLFGLYARDDVAERGNLGAGLAVGGAVLGATACFAGANIGDGPGWWCVLVAGGLATATWLLLWRLVEAGAGLTETITVERDHPAGLRLGALLLAIGLICGRGAAGDWTSAMQTLREFSAASPAVLLAALAAWLEHRLRPSPHRLHGRWLAHGMAPAALYLVLALLALWLLGAPPDTVTAESAP